MTSLRLFTDGSVNPKSKVGYGAYLAVLLEIPYSKAFKADVKVKKFEQTSSAKLEIQTLIWALISIQKPSRLKDEADRFFTLVDKASRKALRSH